jgi:hypothetical protein
MVRWLSWCCLCPQAQYYGAPPRQYRFFKRLAEAFVRVGLIDDSRAQGMPSYSYMPGASLSVKETVSGWVYCWERNRGQPGSSRIPIAESRADSTASGRVHC